MLRAGICDLGTCDLEMGARVSPARLRQPGRGALVRRRPHAGPVRPGEGRIRLWACPPACRLARVQRRAASWQARPVWQLTCSVTIGQAKICRIPPAGAVRFRPGGSLRSCPACLAVSARGSWAFPPGMRQRFCPERGKARRGEAGRVSAGDAPAFPAGRHRPAAGPGRLPWGPPPESRRRIPRGRDPFRTAARDGMGPVARPAGGQPLTSGPARVRLIRRMTRRSRSIAAR